MQPRFTLLALLIFLLPATDTLASTLDRSFADEYRWDTKGVEGSDKWRTHGGRREINDGSGGDPWDIKYLGIDIERSGEKSLFQDKVPVKADISPVPLPSAVWLFGSALLGFIGMSRRTRV